MRVRKARLPDADAISRLIRSLSFDGTLLPRKTTEIYEHIREFTVAESDEGEFLGSGALHLYGPHLAEIRSIAVEEKSKKMGAGKGLVEALLAEAEEQSVPCVCLFTRIPDFFTRFGFTEVGRTLLPDKIYKDCAQCPRLHACDEIAMARGVLPDVAVLGPALIDRQLIPQFKPRAASQKRKNRVNVSPASMEIPVPVAEQRRSGMDDTHEQNSSANAEILTPSEAHQA